MRWNGSYYDITTTTTNTVTKDASNESISTEPSAMIPAPMPAPSNVTSNALLSTEPSAMIPAPSNALLSTEPSASTPSPPTLHTPPPLPDMQQMVDMYLGRSPLTVLDRKDLKDRLQDHVEKLKKAVRTLEEIIAQL